MISRLLLAIGIISVFAVPTSQAAQVPGVQGCVGAGCDTPVAVPGVQGCVGLGCEQCDQDALNKAKAERDKWLAIYREQLGAADDTRQREADALAAAQHEFAKYARGIAEKGVVTVGKQVFKVPNDVVAAYKEAKIASSDKPATDKFLKLTKMYLEELFKESGYETAVQRAKWIDAALSGIAMDAMVLTKLKEAEFHAEQAYKQWLAAYESLMKARRAEDRVRKLEAACRQQRAPDQQNEPPPDEDFKSSGERESDEARQMMDGWEKVDGGFEDAEGNYHLADDAFDDALAIVQGRESFLPPAQPAFAALPALVSEPDAADYQQEWTRFRQPMIRAFQHLVRALEAYGRAEAEFTRLGAALKR
jgi:hypothetical protein